MFIISLEKTEDNNYFPKIQLSEHAELSLDELATFIEFLENGSFAQCLFDFLKTQIDPQQANQLFDICRDKAQTFGLSNQTFLNLAQIPVIDNLPQGLTYDTDDLQ